MTDTPFPINPFTFVSTEIEDAEIARAKPTKTTDGFVIPSLPPYIAASSNAVSSSSPALSTPPKRPPPAPKTAFPDAHLPTLFNQINKLATSNLSYIVETLHQELKEHKVKKNSIEAKVREVAEKCKERKVWILKAQAQACNVASAQDETIVFVPEVL